MDYNDEQRILAELLKMDPSLDDASNEERYARCHAVQQNLDNWEDYTLVELVDPDTFEKKWFWRRKS